MTPAGSDPLHEALLEVLNLKHNAFDKQGFACECKTHSRARAALAAAPAPAPLFSLERLQRALEIVLEDYHHERGHDYAHDAAQLSLLLIAQSIAAPAPALAVAGKWANGGNAAPTPALDAEGIVAELVHAESQIEQGLNALKQATDTLGAITRAAYAASDTKTAEQT